MSDHSVHKANELPRDERILVERWLGRVLSDDETISVNVYRPHPIPDAGIREALRREIVTQAQEIGARAQNATEDEFDALIDKAFAETRGKRD
jgi:hypothetical protein